LKILVLASSVAASLFGYKDTKKNGKQDRNGEKGIKNNVNTHFFWCWRGENGKGMGLRATKTRSFTFFFVAGADWHSFCTFALLYRISEKSTKKIQARMKF